MRTPLAFIENYIFFNETACFGDRKQSCSFKKVNRRAAVYLSIELECSITLFFPPKEELIFKVYSLSSIFYQSTC